jgi:hypothetical protein
VLNYKIKELQRAYYEIAVELLYEGVLGGMEQSVWRLAAGWTVCGSKAGEHEIFRTISDGCLSLV